MKKVLPIFQPNDVNYELVDSSIQHVKRFHKIKSFEFLNQNGVILIHDCLPKKIWNQVVPRLYGHWNGDVWKAIVHARTYKNVDTYTCTVDHGVGIIFKRRNSDDLILNDKNFKDLKFADYYYNHKKFMRPVDHKEFEKILDN